MPIFILVQQKTNFNLIKKVCENKEFYTIIMPSEDTIILEFNRYQKSDKSPCIIYADLECIIEKIDGWKNNPENLPTIKVSEHISSGFSMCTVCSFRSVGNKHDVYRYKDCMKMFSEFLKENTMKTINSKRKKMKLLTKAHKNSYEYVKICYICKENVEDKSFKDKKYRKFRDHCHYTGEYRGVPHSICSLKWSVPKTIPIVFHKGSNYGYHFIIKELSEEFRK